MIVGELADELSAQQLGSETDLELLRDAAPFHLKLSEAVLAKAPGHQKLAEAVAAGFTQYAYAFVAFDADLVEAHDARAAEGLRQRAAALYQRANQHAMQALERSSPGFRARLSRPGPVDAEALQPAQVGLAYWAAAAWGGWISLAKDDANVVADLPLAVRLADLAWLRDPAWGEGALSGLKAQFEAARPGGKADQALAYFDLAIAQAAGKSVGAFVGKAEGYALPHGDRDLFIALLQQGLAIPAEAGSPLALQNEVMRRRAQWLLSRVDDLF